MAGQSHDHRRAEAGSVGAGDREGAVISRSSARDKKGLGSTSSSTQAAAAGGCQVAGSQVVENTINTVIALARHEMVPDLVQILDPCEDASICEFYLNCGHPVLVNAGRRWATKHGYSVVPDASGSGPRWGVW